jgi:prepilin-type N-terminal cleavage/methylation domain-containing protein
MLKRQQYLPISKRRSVPTGKPVPGRRLGLPRASRWGSPRAQRRGFTLVEMMVAVVILSVGLLGLASTSAVVTRQVAGGASQSLAANTIQSRLEWMRSVPCSKLKIKDSIAVNRGIREHWVPGPESNGILWLRDTVQYKLGGRTRRHVYTMTVPCR